MEELLLGVELQGLRNCVYCGVASPRYTRQFHQYSRSCWWVVYKCETCDAMALVKSGMAHPQNLSSAKVDFLLPDRRAVAPELPERAKNYLAQAIASMAAPDGAAMLAGSAVDAMLKGRGYTKGNHYERIEKAVADGLLTKEMAEWAHEVRLGSNNPRHADDETPHMTLEQTERLIEFATMLGKILYVLPFQVEQGKRNATVKKA